MNLNIPENRVTNNYLNSDRLVQDAVTRTAQESARLQENIDEMIGTKNENPDLNSFSEARDLLKDKEDATGLNLNLDEIIEPYLTDIYTDTNDFFNTTGFNRTGEIVTQNIANANNSTYATLANDLDDTTNDTTPSNINAETYARQLHANSVNRPTMTGILQALRGYETKFTRHSDTLEDLENRFEALNNATASIPDFESITDTDLKRNVKSYYQHWFSKYTNALFGIDGDTSTDKISASDFTNKIEDITSATQTLINELPSVTVHSELAAGTDLSNLNLDNRQLSRLRSRKVSSTFWEGLKNDEPVTSATIEDTIDLAVQDSTTAQSNLIKLSQFHNDISAKKTALETRYPGQNRPPRINALLDFANEIITNITTTDKTANLNLLSKKLENYLNAPDDFTAATALTTFEAYFEAQAATSTLTPKPQLSDFETPFRNLGTLNVDPDLEEPPIDIAKTYKTRARINVRNEDGTQVTSRIRRETEIKVSSASPAYTHEQDGQQYNFYTVTKADGTELGTICGRYLEEVTAAPQTGGTA